MAIEHTKVKMLHNAVKEDMNILDYSYDNKNNAIFFDKLTEGNAKIISANPNMRISAIKRLFEDTHIDIVHIHANNETPVFLAMVKAMLRRDHPIVFVSIDRKKIKPSYDTFIDYVKSFMVSVGYRSMYIGRSPGMETPSDYVFTYEYHPSKVIL
jgi:hypothetical protein